MHVLGLDWVCETCEQGKRCLFVAMLEIRSVIVGVICHFHGVGPQVNCDCIRPPGMCLG